MADAAKTNFARQQSVTGSRAETRRVTYQSGSLNLFSPIKPSIARREASTANKHKAQRNEVAGGDLPRLARRLVTAFRAPGLRDRIISGNQKFLGTWARTGTTWGKKADKEKKKKQMHWTTKGRQPSHDRGQATSFPSTTKRRKLKRTIKTERETPQRNKTNQVRNKRK